jgi:hypothetical protein
MEGNRGTLRTIWSWSVKVGDLVKSKVSGPGYGQMGIVINEPDEDFIRPLLDVHFFGSGYESILMMRDKEEVLMMPEELERLNESR